VKDICPCPNPECPNHGDCAKCTSSHLQKGYLSYCAFHTILPAMQQVMAESPDSEASRRLRALVEPQLAAYEQLKAQHGITQEELDRRLARVAKLSQN